MARTLDRSKLGGLHSPSHKPPHHPSQAPGAVDELEVLHPERHVTIAGQALVIREYGHLEWLRLLPRAAPLVDALGAGLAAEREPGYEDALEALSAHGEALLPLIAQAADVEPGWVAALPPDEGELLMMFWWGVNGRFFVRRALNRLAVRLQRERAAGPDATSATPNSAPPSSPTTTPAPTSSATPSAN